MPTASKQKKKPFGTSSRNESNRRNNATAPTRPGKENLTQKSTSTDAPRRDSKTPKASNLTTIGGAYGLVNDFLGMNPTRKKVHAKSKQKLMDRRDAAKKKPDPSPLKRPDPTASTQPSASLSQQPKKKKSSVKSIIASALKRGKSDTSNKGDAKFYSTAGVDNESLSDMDTAVSTPEKASPLITSPHEKPDPPTLSTVVVVARKQSRKDTGEHVRHDPASKKRPEPKFAVIKHNQPIGNNIERGANLHPPAAPLAPFKKRSEEGNPVTKRAAAADVESLDRPNSKQAEKAKIMEAMMNSCKNELEEYRVVGSVVGGASLERSHSDDMSEMTMMDDNLSTTSMTTLGGDNASKAHASKKDSPSLRIPSQLNVQRVDPLENQINTRQANLIDEETIASHITNQLKPGGKLQPINQDDLSQKTYLPAGWKEFISKSKNTPFWRHPDFGTTWHNPGVPMPSGKHPPSQNLEVERAPEPQPSGTSYDNQEEDESVANGAATNLTSNDVSVKESAEDDQSPEDNKKDGGSTTTPCQSKQPDPSPLKKPDPTPTFTASHESESHLASPNTKRISEDYQKLLAPYESIEKSVVSKALSVASSRQSKASFYDDNSSKCLTQEFTITKNEEEVVDGTPSIGNSVGKMDDDNGSVEFDNAQDMEDYDEDDVLNDRHNDLNSLSSDHVDVDALLTQRKNDSPMSTIRETLNESVVDASPSSVVSSVDYGNVDGMSHKSNDDKASERYSDIDGLSLNSDDGINSQSSQGTFSKSAIKNANTAGEAFSDDDLDNDDGSGDENPIFESHVDDADDSDDEVEASHPQSRRKRSKVDRLNLSLDLRDERLSDPRKRKFFPPGPLCSLQFLDEIEDGDFDTPLWRRMKRSRSSLTSVKRGKAAYKAKKLRQSH